MTTSYTTTGRARPEQFVAFGAGTLLLASGVLHALFWLADGSSLTGPISLRKPILFGLSAGVTVISIGWLIGKMRRRAGDGLLINGFSLAMLVEVGLITLQQWRGVASHFNRSTPLDAAVLAWIGWLIVFATIVIAELTRRSFRPLRTTADMTFAIRSGMGLLLFSCLLGFVLVAYGDRQVSLGRSPEVYGAAGVMKFPHGVPMHAIQFLPIWAWLLTKLHVPEQDRLRAAICAFASMATFTAFSLVQTFTGQARFDVNLATASLLIVAALFGGIALWSGVLPCCLRWMKSRSIRAAARH